MPLPPLDEEELFHDVMEHSFTPDSALELMKNWNLGQYYILIHHLAIIYEQLVDYNYVLLQPIVQCSSMNWF